MKDFIYISAAQDGEPGAVAPVGDRRFVHPHWYVNSADGSRSGVGGKEEGKVGQLRVLEEQADVLSGKDRVLVAGCW